MLDKTKYFHYRLLRKLLRVSRSLNHISLSGDSQLLIRLARTLSLTSMGKVSRLSKTLIPESIHDEINIHVRQRLTVTTLQGPLFQKLALVVDNPNQKIALAIPSAWRYKLREKGYRVAGFSSSVLWVFLQMKFFVRAVYNMLHLMWMSWNYRNIRPTGRYWVLDGIPHSALPIGSEKDSFRLASFLLNRMKDRDMGGITWGCIPGGSMDSSISSVTISSEPFPAFASHWETISYGIECLWILIRGFLSWIFGDSHAPIITLEAIPTAYLRRMSRDELPSWYVATNSFLGYRPVWTRLAEQYGVRTALAFYSTNNKPMQLKGQPSPSEYPSIELMNWPCYLVWDEFQAKWVRSVARGNPEILTLGPIPLSDNNSFLPVIPEDAIAVFDINLPNRTSRARKGIVSNYYSDELIEEFLLDLADAIGSIGRTMVLKTKRSIGRFESKKHLQLIKVLGKKNHVIVIDASINAERIIEKTSATISIPFTSTSVISKLRGKPAAFYDPTGTIVCYKDVAHGVKMLQNISDLRSWLSTIT